MSDRLSDAIESLYRSRCSDIVLGLTGRTGSGCTSAAGILSRSQDLLELPEILAPVDVLGRKERIVQRFAKENWVPFKQIQVTPLIASFLLDGPRDSYLALLKRLRVPSHDKVANQRTSEHVDRIRGQYSEIIRALKNDDIDAGADTRELHELVDKELTSLVESMREALEKDYTRVMQEVADSCRQYGGPYADTHRSVDHLFTLARRIVRVHRILAKEAESNRNPGYFVIDALRNPFETQWVRDHTRNFFLVAVNTLDEDRRSRLHFQNLDKATIDALNEREYPQRRKSVPSGIEAWVSQDIQACLERADIHVHNPGSIAADRKPDLGRLSAQLIRYVSLIQHPGLVTPTREERCMQIAYVARANSGCISRQVGAAITSKSGSLVAIGWNDVPYGHVPCLLRNRDDLLNGQDQAAFSTFENKADDFRTFIGKELRLKSEQRSLLKGRSTPFCFRDTYNKHKGEKNQVHTRSLHAEENAFLQLSLNGVQMPSGAVLFSTASPCELCSKKAFQLGVSRIVYIDPYPGISMDHILGAGEQERRPVVTLFSGAIGDAYHRLYQPLLTFKDELQALTRIEEGHKDQGAEEKGLFS